MENLTADVIKHALIYTGNLNVKFKKTIKSYILNKYPPSPKYI